MLKNKTKYNGVYYYPGLDNEYAEKPYKVDITIKKKRFFSRHPTDIEAAKAADRVYAEMGIYEKFNFLKPIKNENK